MSKKNDLLNENEQKSESYINGIPKQVKWGGALNEFLWICAGVNRKVLRQCPTDYAKYAGIGGTILFTALMATLSGGYALFTVFDNPKVAIAFGVFWGLLIFNLDRFIVNTMYSDGKVTISWREFYCGLPRIIMAIFLGIVISTPLELRIFEDNIKMEIDKEKHKILEDRLESLVSEQQKIEDQIISVQQGVGDLYGDHVHTGNQQLDALADSIDQNQPILNSVQNQLSSLSAQILKLDKNSDTYISQKNQIEAKARPLYARRSILSSKLKKWRAERIRLKGQLVDISIRETDDKRNRILALQQAYDSIGKKISDARTLHHGWSDEEIRLNGSERDKINLEYSGFNAHLKAFNDIRTKDSATDIAAWFIMLLFVIIETAPTFFKMMIASGPYDDMLRAEMHKVRVLSDKRISDINDDINTEVQISTKKNQARLEVELLANKKVLEQIAAAQAELLSTAIEKWREQELEKIAEDPSVYIKTKD